MESNYKIFRLNLFKAKGYEFENAYPNPYFSPEETELYISQNKNLVNKWIIFLDSCLIYTQKCIPALNVETYLTDGVEIITDKEYIGQSIVKLFSLDFFFHNYYNRPIKTQCYFKPQFEEYMFQGKNLYHYFANKYNFFYVAFWISMVYDSIKIFVITQKIRYNLYVKINF